MSLRSLAFAVAGCILFAGATLAEDKPTHIVAGISGADDVLRDLKYIVVDLAKKDDAWEDVVEPNITIFLIGVDEARPVRFDALLDDSAEFRTVPMIPISNLKDFLNDNLNPIGIIPKRSRRDKDLYELTGSVMEGWLRHLPDGGAYAVISKELSDVPKDMEHPSESHKELVEKGYLLFAHLKNEPETAEGRAKAFGTFSSNLTDAIQKRPDETKEAFELRKVWSKQQMDQLRQWFVECGEFEAGLKVDMEGKQSVADLLFSALPGTDLSKGIEKLASEPSYFAPVQQPENAVASLRLHFSLNPAMSERYKEIYTLTKPVAEQIIQRDKEASDEVKAARVEFSNLLLKIMTESVDVGVVDLFADLAPSGDHHNLLLGVRCSGQDSITEALKVFPKTEKDVEFTADVAEVEGVKIHQLKLTKNVGASLKEFYGETAGTIYFGVGPEAFWVASGDNSLEHLKATITKVRTAEKGESDNVLASVHVQALPLVKLLDGMATEEGGLDLLEEMRKRGLLAPKAEAAKEEKKDDKKGEESKDRTQRRQQRTQQLQNFKWRPIALEELAKQDGTFDLEFKRTSEGTLTGKATSSEGLLRTLGALIAVFAEENLN
ncbi:MAG: hypothetical protein H6824_16025 [Planctomycetaceae bacterium]|nr:hypothetical protein [Planctomycetaceae bacterium]